MSALARTRDCTCSPVGALRPQHEQVQSHTRGSICMASTKAFQHRRNYVMRAQTHISLRNAQVHGCHASRCTKRPLTWLTHPRTQTLSQVHLMPCLSSWRGLGAPVHSTRFSLKEGKQSQAGQTGSLKPVIKSTPQRHGLHCHQLRRACSVRTERARLRRVASARQQSDRDFGAVYFGAV